MIVFDLECRSGGHRFEGWFGSSADFERQQQSGLVTCPSCGSSDVGKAVMAPNVGRKGNQIVPAPPSQPAGQPVMTAPAPAPVPALPPEAIAMFRAVAEAQAEALKSSRWVGDRFVDTARAIHYGEQDPEPVHGQASPDEARALAEEGIEIAPILFPVVPPGDAN